ncbi:MAG: hypothetical protein L6R36_008805 [Xanthoria steineri]|nr:MAG: hypothetical protein L6R36_008805 [Xanthoria steineri]
MSSDTALPNASTLAQMPAISPPPGVRFDFNGPNPLAYTITTVASVFVALTLFFLAIRTYAKVKIHRKGTWDDGKFHQLSPSLMPSFLTHTQSPVRSACRQITTLTYWIICLLLVKNEGFGRHLWDIPLSVFISEEILKLSYVSGWLSNVANIFVKLTFFILYWSIFYPFRWLRYVILGGAAVVTGVYAGFIMYVLISDTPQPGQTWLEKAQANQERGTSGGVKLAMTLAAWGLVTDVYILLLPISGVMRLQLSRKKRIALLTVFMTGIGSKLWRESDPVPPSVQRRKINLFPSLVELCVGIMITCVPTTSVFLRHILQPRGLLRSASSSILERLRSHWAFTQQFSSRGKDVEKDKSSDSDRPYRHLKERGFAVSEDGVHNLKPYTDRRTETMITAQPAQNCDRGGIQVRTDFEQA